MNDRKENSIEPRISVIVPVYNTGNVLNRTLDSILGQTISDIEIICIDDGSTDGSGFILDTYAKKDCRIRVIHKNNEGLVQARKDGVLAARADYLGFVDSDDWIECDMYEKMYMEAQFSEADLVATGFYIDSQKKNMYNGIPDGRYDLSTDRKWLYEGLIINIANSSQGLLPRVWTKLYRRSLFLQTMQDIDVRIRHFEDLCFSYSYFIECNRISIINKCFYHYSIILTSMSHAPDDYYFARLNLAYLFLKKKFLKTMYGEVLLPQLDRVISSAIQSGLNGGAGMGIDGYVQYGFPFDRIRDDRRIVIYGAGTCGKRLLNGLSKKNDKVIVAVLDKKPEKCLIDGYRVLPLHSIKQLDFDRVIIAIRDENIAQEMRENLISLGVEDGKIIWMSI